MGALRWRSGRSLEDRGEDVDELDRCIDARSPPFPARQLHEQRDLECLAVEEDAVLLFAVLVESFAVIGEKDDERFVVDAFLFQKIEKLPDDGIGAGDLAAVVIRISPEQR